MRAEFVKRVTDAFPELNIIQVAGVVKTLESLMSVTTKDEAEILELKVNERLQRWLEMVTVPVCEIAEISKETHISKKTISAYIQTGMPGYLVMPPAYVRIKDKVVRAFVILKR